MDPGKLDLLSNDKLPETVRVALVQALQAEEAAAGERALEAERLAQERRKFVWNTPVVAALAGLITLTATFVYDRMTARDATENTITLETVREELSASNAQLLQQLEQEKALTDAEIAARAHEREFQYRIVEAELTDRDKSNAERAAVLLFLVRAGILNTLDRDELEAMAQAQIDNPNQDIIPRLTGVRPIRGVIGEDDARPVAGFDAGDRVQRLARSVGQLHVQIARAAPTTCTAFLIAPDRIATADYCVGDFDEASFVLGERGEISLHEVTDAPDSARGAVGRKIAELTISPPAPDSHPPLATGAVPEEGAELGAIYFRGENLRLAVWGGEACRLVSVAEDSFAHSCDTGGGTGGAPVFDAATGRVIGVHYQRTETGGMALRMDAR